MKLTPEQIVTIISRAIGEDYADFSGLSYTDLKDLSDQFANAVYQLGDVGCRLEAAKNAAYEKIKSELPDDHE